MLYERSMQIEQRLETVLRLVRSGRYSTPKIAEELGVSIPTVSRALCALRARGHDIRAERHDHGWRYVLKKTAARKNDNDKREPDLADTRG